MLFAGLGCYLLLSFLLFFNVPESFYHERSTKEPSYQRDTSAKRLITTTTTTTFTVGCKSYMCLPACEASHLFCHLTVQESFTALLMSIEVRGVHTSGMFSASTAASFASLSAIYYFSKTINNVCCLPLNRTYFFHATDHCILSYFFPSVLLTKNYKLI